MNGLPAVHKELQPPWPAQLPYEHGSARLSAAQGLLPCPDTQPSPVHLHAYGCQASGTSMTWLSKLRWAGCTVSQLAHKQVHESQPGTACRLFTSRYAMQYLQEKLQPGTETASASCQPLPQFLEASVAMFAGLPAEPAQKARHWLMAVAAAEPAAVPFDLAAAPESAGSAAAEPSA